jgi:acetyl-CoA carboxylase biotin carboxylase subunit
MGNKLEARRIAREVGVPVVPGSEKVDNAEQARAAAEKIGYPVLLKAAAGGGGRGMKIVAGGSALREAFTAAAAEARAAFRDGTLYVERFVANARHIEVQVLGDRFGGMVHLGERDCSLQRRYQKIVEEAPAPFLSEKLKERVRSAAVALAGSIGYENAGTVEFIVDPDGGEFYFLEMNTRIQVEHPVTEMITGLDLVKEQLRIGAGQPLGFAQSEVNFAGHAVECRINAESPAEDFRPCPGRLITWRPAEGEGLRVDSHCFEGYSVPPYYDSLLAKLIAWGNDRAEAIKRMQQALDVFITAGVETTIPFLRFLLSQHDYGEGRVHTRWAEERIAEFCLK